jgi:hypothetical protein
LWANGRTDEHGGTSYFAGIITLEAGSPVLFRDFLRIGGPHKLGASISPEVTERKTTMETKLLTNGLRYLSVLAVVLCVGLFSIPGDVSAGEGLLDGKTFVVETGEKGKAATDKDTITFRDGNFHSMDCDKYGFGDGTYKSTMGGDIVRFEAVTTSPTKGKMTWKGTVKADKIEVDYVWVDSSHWYKPNPKPLEKWGKGELKK